MAKATRQQDWKTGLCDSGEDADCPRSCFIGCDQFGRTRHRLNQLDRNEDSLDLSKYEGCNSSCWDYFFLCVGGLYIGSGIYTGKQTKRIRNTYGIKGSYSDDVVKGIFCQPCSLIRNDLEVRRREQEKNVELAQGLQPPMPFGEENFRPIFTMPVTDGYQREPHMSTANPPQYPGREVHFHPTADQSGNGFRTVPLYPTEQEIRDHARDWNGLVQLPHIPTVTSPLEGLDRRSQLLTPISERDSTEEARAQQLRENSPKFPQVHNWLKAVSLGPNDKPTIEKSVLVPGPGNPPTLLAQQGKSCPEACPKPAKKEKGKKPAKIGGKSKRSKFGSKRKSPGEPAAKNPDILVTLPVEQVAEPGATPSPERPVAEASSGLRAGRSPEHNLSTDVLVASPSESQRQHSLQADVVVPSPSESQRQYSIREDSLVSGSSESQRQYSIRADALVPTPIASPMPEHDISADEGVEFLPLTGREHSLSKDKRVEGDESPMNEHRLSKDKQVNAEEAALREHSLDSDSLVTVEEESDSEPEQEPLGHTLPEDTQVSSAIEPTKQHDLQTDARVPTPKPIPAREHSLSRDIRVPTPNSRGPFARGIHPDESVPTPELVRLNLEHDILQDQRVLSPSPAYEEHDLHADGRVKSPALLPPRQHSIRSDKRVSEPAGKSRDHSIQADEVSSPSGRRRKEHSMSADTKVAQRAYQLLENFLEQDTKPVGRGSK